MTATDRFKAGDIVRCGSGVSALFRYEGTHNAGRLYGMHVLGGAHSAADDTFFMLQPASAEDIEFCRQKRPEWFATDAAALQALALRCEATTSPSRLLDFEIHIAAVEDAVWPVVERDGRVSNPNSRMSDYVRIYRDVIDADDQDFEFPRYTRSLDAAVLLVPEDWYWQVGRTTSFCGWAKIYATHPDHGEKDRNEFYSNCEHWKPIQIPPINCLLACALRARASDAYQRALRRKATGQ